jgi:hypothetical protein
MTAHCAHQSRQRARHHMYKGESTVTAARSVFTLSSLSTTTPRLLSPLSRMCRFKSFLSMRVTLTRKPEIKSCQVEDVTTAVDVRGVSVLFVLLLRASCTDAACTYVSPFRPPLLPHSPFFSCHARCGADGGRFFLYSWSVGHQASSCPKAGTLSW